MGQIEFEKAKTKVRIRWLKYHPKETWTAFAIFSKSGLTCYAFQDDITLDVFRLQKNKKWRCFGVPDSEFEITRLKK
jgi:hypothetical protein